MERINGNNTVDIGGGKRGFRSQNAAAGVAGTEVTDKFLNDIQEEISAVIENSGLELDPDNQQQLWDALQNIAAPGFANRTPWLPIISMTTTAPPNNAVVGDAYIIPAGATGAWAGHAQKIAEWSGLKWRLILSRDGHGVSLPDGRVFQRVGGVYIEKIAQDAQSGKWNYVVAGGTANGLTGALNPPLLSYADGMEVRVKATSNNTGPVTLNLGAGAKPVTTLSGQPLQKNDLLVGCFYSFLYNGNSWITILESQRVLSGDITFFVRPDGNDNNTGFANTAAGAFKTIQGAIDAAVRRYITASYKITIRVADGSYEPFTLKGGVGTYVEVIGNVANPNLCKINATGEISCVEASLNSTLRISGFALNGGIYLVFANDRSSISVGDVFLGTCTSYQLCAANNSIVNVVSNLTINGEGRSLLVGSSGGVVNCVGRTIKFLNIVTYSTATAWANNGTIVANGLTFVGSSYVRGRRYRGDAGGMVFTAGAGENYFPGDENGSIGSGGIYV